MNTPIALPNIKPMSQVAMIASEPRRLAITQSVQMLSRDTGMLPYSSPVDLSRSLVPS